MPTKPRNRRRIKRSFLPLILLGIAVIGVSSVFLLRRHSVSHSIRIPPTLPDYDPRGAILRPKATVEQRLQEFGDAARKRLRPAFIRAGIAYPPRSITLIGVKQERRMEIYAPDKVGKPHFIRSFPILAASGKQGPKLKEGDCQVPEGFYHVVFLNANSRFHVSLRLDYPNTFDREQATREGRTKLGGNIMIHGNRVSIGCLAMGDVASEDLFTLAADTGQEKISVILSPVDFRSQSLPEDALRPRWVTALYGKLKETLRLLPLPT